VDRLCASTLDERVITIPERRSSACGEAYRGISQQQENGADMAKDGSDEAKDSKQEGSRETRGGKGSERSKRKSGGGKDLSVEAGEAGQGGEAQHSGKRKRSAGDAGGGPSPRENRRQSGEGLSPKDANNRKAKTPRGAAVSDGGKRMVAAAMGKSGAEGGANEKEVEPPVRVMKNPDFLQEHRDRYKAPHQKVTLPKQQQQGKGQQDGGKGGGSAGGKVPCDVSSAGGAGAGGGGAPMSSRQRNKDRKFVYGNYDTYYNYRNPGDAQEPRLAVMRKEWFEGKRALDIGCNSGAVTIDIARTMHCRHIMGVDIDKSLVTKARSHLKWKAAGCPPRTDKAVSNSGNSEDKAAAAGSSSSSNNNNNNNNNNNKKEAEEAPPASATAHKGTETRPGRQALDSSLPDPDADPFAFPYNCGFRHEVRVCPPLHAFMEFADPFMDVRVSAGFG
jgi:hypothetical protein